jgi:hypothetical protein
LALDRLRYGDMDLSFNTSFDDYWKATRERLDAEFERSVSRFFDQQPAAHVAAVREVLMGGKRLRGCLVCLLNEALGGTPAAAIPRAMAVECVQAASLIHDDLLDGDTLRRDRAATWTIKGPRRAVLLGDLIFATALQRMAELGRDDGLALAEAIANMAAGAYREPGTNKPRAGSSCRHGQPLPSSSTSRRASCSVPRPVWERWRQVPHALAALATSTASEPAGAYQMPMTWTGRRRSGGSIGAAGSARRPCGISVPKVNPPARAVLTAEDAARLRPQLRKGMMGAIETRLQQARAAVDQLPIGRYRLQLQTAPRDIVRAMWVGAP